MYPRKTKLIRKQALVMRIFIIYFRTTKAFNHRKDGGHFFYDSHLTYSLLYFFIKNRIRYKFSSFTFIFKITKII